MDTKINAWQCAKCGVLQPGPDLDLWMALCNCGVGAGQWGVIDLAAALKASEEQNGAIRRGLDWERAEREKVAGFARKIGRDRDALAAANLAANKRIVELEHERDAALLAAQGARRTAFNAEQKAKALDAVQRDTIARLEAQVKELRAELARLTMPRPIVEAPTDRPVLGIWIDHRGNKCVEVLRWDGRWRGALGTPLYREAEYLPMPEVKP